MISLRKPNLLILTIFLVLIQLQSPLLAEKDPVSVELISQTVGTGKTEPLTVALKFTLEPGWKLYVSPPDTDSSAPLFGTPPEIDWSKSENLESTKIQFPPGKCFGSGIYATYGYNKDTIIPVEIKLIDESKPLILRAEVDYFACADLCRPFHASLEMTLKPEPATPTKEALSIEKSEQEYEQLHEKILLEESGEIFLMIFFALLGGFILNFMPCVLPVLSLKILSFSKAHHPHYRSKFFITLLGILVSFLSLGLILLLLRSMGLHAGWGLHFQQPAFLGFMIAVLLLFAANLLGFFEIPLPRFIADAASHKTRGHIGDFLSGVFASLLATPCSAPFLGTAVGFALSQSYVEIILIFLSLGLGFGMPYILGILFPGVLKKLPRPGAWMEKLRKFLGLILVITAAWLGTILYSHLKTPDTVAEFYEDLSNRWIPFNETDIPDLISKGKVVFVDVTAKWCVTCHVNKGFVLSNAEIQKILNLPQVVLMQADWTKHDSQISSYLKKFGRHGIPCNIIYSASHPKGIVLPELLTVSTLQEEFKTAGISVK